VVLYQVGLRFNVMDELPLIGGHAWRPCIGCGRKHLNRVRLVNRVDGQMEVINICVPMGCLRQVVGSIHGSTPEVVGKIRINGVKDVVCRFCGCDAKGGLWVRGKVYGVIDPEPVAHVCYDCLMSRIEEVRQKAKKVVE
jgi:hypothetical protein